MAQQGTGSRFGLATICTTCGITSWSAAPGSHPTLTSTKHITIFDARRATHGQVIIVVIGAKIYMKVARR